MENKKGYKKPYKKADSSKEAYKPKRGPNDGSGFTVHGEGLGGRGQVPDTGADTGEHFSSCFINNRECRSLPRERTLWCGHTQECLA